MSNFLNNSIRLLLFLLFFPAGIFGGELFFDRERLENIVDDTPLARSEDKPAWDDLFDFLRRHEEVEIEKVNADSVGFLELSCQPVEYRGKLVRITGRLVRCEFIPQRNNSTAIEEEIKKESPIGFYESWIIVKDKKDVPVCVCSLEKPAKLQLGDGLSESVSVTGFFYKRRLFLSSDGEEVTTPTILAKTFHWTPPKEKPKAKQPFSVIDQIRNNTVTALALLFALWLVVRFSSQYWQSKRKHISFQFSDSMKKEEPSSSDKSEINHEGAKNTDE